VLPSGVINDDDDDDDDDVFVVYCYIFYRFIVKRLRPVFVEEAIQIAFD